MRSGGADDACPSALGSTGRYPTTIGYRLLPRPAKISSRYSPSTASWALSASTIDSATRQRSALTHDTAGAMIDGSPWPRLTVHVRASLASRPDGASTVGSEPSRLTPWSRTESEAPCTIAGRLWKLMGLGIDQCRILNLSGSTSICTMITSV